MYNDAKLAFLTLGLGFCAGFIIGGMFANSLDKKEAIEKGFAELNQTTGAWQWKEHMKKDYK